MRSVQVPPASQLHSNTHLLNNNNNNYNEDDNDKQ